MQAGTFYNKHQPTSRKTIVVVGKKDHGKTAFVNMIKMGSPLRDMDLPFPDDSFALYRVNPDRLFNPSQSGDDLFVIDTPGFTSKSTLFVDVDRLQKFIADNRFQIVTVAYMLDMDKGREKDEHGEGVLNNFLQLLKLKLKIKKSIISMVLPRFDDRYKKLQRNLALQKQFQLDFEASGLPQIWANRIEWMSRPECDCEQYDDIIRRKTQKNQVAHDSEKEQWKKLQKHLTKVIQKKGNQKPLYLSIDEYQSDLQKFKSKIKMNVGKLYTEHSSFVRGTFEVEYDVRKDQLKERNVYAKYANPIAAIAGCLFFVCEATVVHYGLEDNIVPYVMAFVLAALVTYVVRRHCLSLEQISFNYDKNDQPKIKDVLTTQVASYLRSNIEKSTCFTSNSVRMDRLLGITNVSAVMVDKDKKQGSMISFEKNGESYEGKICEEGTLRLTYEVQIPTKESYQLFLKKEVQIHYG